MANKARKNISQKGDRPKKSKNDKQSESLLEERVRKSSAELEAINKKLKKKIENHKRVKASLFELETENRILGNISDVFLLLNNDLVITYFNKAAEKQLGRRSVNVIGRNFFEAFPEARDSNFEKKFKRVLKDKKSVSFETCFAMKPYENWYDIRVYPLKDGISVYFQVTTERKRAEDEIKRFSSFPQLNPNPVLEIDSSGTIVFCNAAAVQALRKLNLRDTTLFLPNDVSDILDALEQEKDVQFYREVKIKDRIFGEVLCLTPQFDSIRIYANDITENKSYQEALQNSLLESRQREKEMSALSSASKAILKYPDFESTAKEIFDYCKQLLGATSGYISLLSKDGAENEVLFLDSGGLPCTVDPELPMPIRGLRGEAYNKLKTVYDNNFHQSEWMKFMPDGHATLENVLFAPMIVEGKAVGLLGIANKPGGFNENDARIASAFAELSAIALTQKRSEDTLRHNEEYFRLLMENASDAVTILEGDGTIRYESLSVEQMLGYKPEELVGTNALDLIHPDDVPNAAVALSQLLQKPGLTLYSEFRCRHKDGSLRILGVTGRNFLDHRVIKGVVVNSRDITEKVQADKAVKSERQKLINILDSMVDGVYIVNQKNEIEYVNPLLESEYGPVNGRKCHDYFEGRKKACTWCKNEEVFRGKTVRWEWYSEKTNKTYDLINTPLKNPDGSISKLGIFRDITDRREAEDALRKSEERFRAVFESSSDCILVWDRQYNYLYANKAAIDHVGTTRDKVIGKNICDGLGHIPDFMHLWMERVDRVFASGKSFRVEDSVLVGDRLVYSESQVSPILDANGQVFAVGVVYRNITDRKLIEEVLRKSREDLDRAQAVGNIGSWRMDVQRNELTWSDENHRIFGVPKGLPMTYEMFLSIVHPDDREYVDKKWKAGLAGENYDIEHRIVVDGNTKWVREKAYLEFGKDGALLGGFGITQDITDRKHAEDLIRESESKYRSLFSNMTNGFAFHKILLNDIGKPFDYVFLEINDSFERLTGLRRQDIIGKKVTDVIPGIENNPVDWIGIYGKVAMSGESIQFENYAAALKKWYAVSAYSPTKEYFAVSFEDITERKQREKLSEGLNRINEVISSTLDLDEIMRMVVVEAAKVMGSETAGIALRENGHWVSKYTYLFPPEVDGMCFTDQELPEVALAARIKKPVVINDTFNDERVNRQIMERYGVRSILTLPLISTLEEEEEVLGVMGFNFHSAPTTFTDAQIDFATKLGVSVSLALEKAKLFEELEMRVQERTKELKKTVDALHDEIEERIIAQKTIQEQSDILDSLFNDTLTPLVLLDPDFNFIRVNEAYARACQKDKDEFKGHNHFEFYPHEENEAIFRKVVESKFPYQAIAKPFVFPDHPEWGVTYWDWTLTPLLDEYGEVKFLVFSLNNVTERKQAEKAVEAERQRLYSVLENIPAYVCLLTPDYTFAYVNNEFIKLFGDPGTNRKCHEFLFNLRKPCEGCQTYRIFTENKNEHRWEWVGPNGNTYAIYDHAFSDIDGTPLILEMGLDITDRKRAEDSLRESEERYRMLVETMNEGLGMYDENDLLIYANERLCEMLGYSQDEIINRSVFILFDVNNQNILREQLEKRRRGENDPYRIEWTGKGNKKIITLVSPKGIFDANGDYRGSFAIITDVTEKLRLESIAQAVNTMNNIGFIFSGIRHEIGNPVNSIKMALSVLKQNIDSYSKDTIKEYADRMLSEVSRMEYLLKAMKSFNMYETVELIDTDMTDFMNKFISLVKGDFEKKGIKVEASISGPAWIYADPRALQQVLLNILTNSADSLEGRQDPRITINVSKMADMVNIRVEDNGIGMTEIQQEDLFKPFCTAKSKGTGLGLVIAKKMMTKMKGLIEVVSEKDKGTIVDLFIPEGISE